MTTLDRNPARFSSMIVGGGIPLLNGEDGAIGPTPTRANFLSSLQRSMQDAGMAPASLYGFKAGAPQPWYRPDLQADPTALSASWNAYVDGANMGTYRGGLLGLMIGSGVMLAALYFGGAMTSSPKPEAKSTASVTPTIVTASSRHRRKGSRHHGR